MHYFRPRGINSIKSGALKFEPGAWPPLSAPAEKEIRIFDAGPVFALVFLFFHSGRPLFILMAPIVCQTYIQQLNNPPLHRHCALSLRGEKWTGG